MFNEIRVSAQSQNVLRRSPSGTGSIWRWMLAEEAIQTSFVATPVRPGTPHQFIRQCQRSLIQLCPQLRAPSLSFLEVIDHDRW
jgi:hypothetical protein